MSSPSAHLLHNLAHIELNAVDLAWDTVRHPCTCIAQQTEQPAAPQLRAGEEGGGAPWAHEAMQPAMCVVEHVCSPLPARAPQGAHGLGPPQRPIGVHTRAGRALCSWRPGPGAAAPLL